MRIVRLYTIINANRIALMIMQLKIPITATKMVNVIYYFTYYYWPYYLVYDDGLF